MNKYFKLSEFLRSATAERRGIVNVPNKEQMNNLRHLMDYLEGVREAFGKRIVISSGYRSEELNRLVGGVKHSQHCMGLAADLQVASRAELKELEQLILRLGGFDQLIWEQSRSGVLWLHVSIAPEGVKPRGQHIPLLIKR